MIGSFKDGVSLIGSSLGKRLRQSEIEPTDMIPVDMRPIHKLSSITENPFDTETLREKPVVTELIVIG